MTPRPARPHLGAAALAPEPDAVFLPSRNAYVVVAWQRPTGSALALARLEPSQACCGRRSSSRRRSAQRPLAPVTRRLTTLAAGWGAQAAFSSSSGPGEVEGLSGALARRPTLHSSLSSSSTSVLTPGERNFGSATCSHLNDEHRDWYSAVAGSVVRSQLRCGSSHGNAPPSSLPENVTWHRGDWYTQVLRQEGRVEGGTKQKSPSVSLYRRASSCSFPSTKLTAAARGQSIDVCRPWQGRGGRVFRRRAAVGQPDDCVDGGNVMRASWPPVISGRSSRTRGTCWLDDRARATALVEAGGEKRPGVTGHDGRVRRNGARMFRLSVGGPPAVPPH